MNTTRTTRTANRRNRTFRSIFNRINHTPYQHVERRNRSGYQYLIAGAGLTMVLAACGGGDDGDSDLTRDFIASELMEATGLPEADVDCIVDSALDQFSLQQLATMSGDNPDPAVESEIVGITTDCLLNSDNLDEIIANEMSDDDDEDADSPSDAPDGEPVSLNNGEQAPPPTTAPPVTAPPTTLPPTTLPPATLPPTTEPELQLAGSPFCLASADYVVAVGAIDELMELGAGVPVHEAAFKRMFNALDRAVDSAPAPELRVEAETARTAMTAVHGVTAELGYDVVDLDPAAYGIDDEFEVLEASFDRLEQFLTGVCGESTSDLDDRAETLTDELLTTATTGTTGTTDSTGVPVTDDLDRIYVEAPASWASIDGAPGTSIADLIVAVDTETFLTSWAGDGVRITIVDEGENVDWTAPLSELDHFVACDFLDAETYDDGAYFGTINTFENCGRAGADAAVIIATNTDGFDLAVMVEIQMATWDQDSADLILSSFLVR